MLKKTVGIIYIVMVAVMGAATIVEHQTDTVFAAENIYGAWWFVALWAALVGSGAVYFVRQLARRKKNLHNVGLIALHLSFVVILAGALLTHLTSFRGMVHLRGDQSTSLYLTPDGTGRGRLPFALRLDKFSIVNHAGTAAAADYLTRFVITDGPKTVRAQVSMNRVFDYRGVRFYQSSYDTDGLGSYLSINSDPYGLPVTYAGYGVLFLSLIWLLVDPRGEFRRLLGHPLIRGGVAVGVLLCVPVAGRGRVVLPRESAERFGRLFVEYNNRICPVQTFAIDFTQKLYGQRSYGDASAEQVLLSWIFYPDEWSREPIIRVKSGELRERFGLPEFASVNSFFRGGGYILGPYVAQYSSGSRNAFHQACAEIDGRLQVVMSVSRGAGLSIFPHTFADGRTEWFAPRDEVPREVPAMDGFFFRNVFRLLSGELRSGNFAEANMIIDKLGVYQKKNAAAGLPTETQVTAERIYNRIPFATMLFMLNLTLGLLALAGMIYRSGRVVRGSSRGLGLAMLAMLCGSFAALSFALALRWIISGNVPLSNGYETMLATAWFVMAITILAAATNRRLMGVATTFGLLLSGFLLLVSHLGQMDPAIGPIMPVLNSPLLSVHVSLMMMSYALLALTFVCSLTALLTVAAGRLRGFSARVQVETLQVLSRIFLYPAMTTMGLGIFIGAIWANISWGNYWSWDPKETWALITFMLYAVVLHTQSLPVFRRPMAYHVYMLAAFLSIVMTYFGVNYVLGGMHSYA